jgi:hypothetical protein
MCLYGESIPVSFKCKADSLTITPSDLNCIMHTIIRYVAGSFENVCVIAAKKKKKLSRRKKKIYSGEKKKIYHDEKKKIIPAKKKNLQQSNATCFHRISMESGCVPRVGSLAQGVIYGRCITVWYT